jgi:hypothetical protein
MYMEASARKHGGANDDVHHVYRNHLLAFASPDPTRDMTTSRSQQVAAFERWADEVAPEDLIALDTSPLQAIARLASQRELLEASVCEAVNAARVANRSWSEIGAMLGVSKQAAQRRYGNRAAA